MTASCVCLQQIVHRDVKLENVLLNAGICTKLIDFGLISKDFGLMIMCMHAADCT